MEDFRNVQPPGWPLKILRFFVRKEFLEEIEGDMEEIFRDNAGVYSYGKARRLYVWETLRLLRPVLMKNLHVIENLNQKAMLGNYFKVSLRGMMKNPLNSFINLFGLAAAIGICVFAYAYASWTYRTDDFHTRKHEVYLATFLANRDGEGEQFGRSPALLADAFRSDFAQIDKVCRVMNRNVVLKHGDKVFHERVQMTDPDFTDMFTFPLKWGSPATLSDINSVIMSEEAALKYFGDVNPVGENVLVIFGDGNSKAFKVTGVAAAFPSSKSFAFNMLMNIDNMRVADSLYDAHDWSQLVDATLISVTDPAQVKIIEAGMNKYKALQNAAVGEEWAIDRFVLEQFSTIHRRTEHIRDDIFRSAEGNYKGVAFMVVIAVFLLLLACFNYINIAIATAAKRLKEIGVRKSIGANRRTVVVQFLSENLVITFFALVIGCFIGAAFFIPAFEGMWNFNMEFSLADSKVWIYLTIVLLFTSIASGIYPSLYISRFEVVGILKGAVRFGQKNPLTKVLLAFQLVLACIFITCAVMFTQNSMYLAQRPWGYNQDLTLYAAVPDYAAFEKLAAAMSNNPDVLLKSGSAHHIGKSHSNVVVRFPEREYEVQQLGVDANYFRTMGIPIAKGRGFTDHEGSDRRAAIVNDVFVRNLGWDNAIGRSFRIGDVEYDIIGVTAEFHSYSFNSEVEPAVFTVADRAAFRYLTLQVRAGSEVRTQRDLESKWATLFPEVPFEGGHQEDVWGNYFNAVYIHSIVWRVFAFIAITLAAMGMYGLISLNVSGRVREFSIRKVFGAKLSNIATSISRQYVVLFLAAIVVGAPAGHVISKSIIVSAYTYHLPVNFSSVAAAVGILLVIALLTISTQVRRVMKENPVSGLKAE